MKLKKARIRVYAPKELKPFRIPPGLQLIQDTREQLPLFDNPPEGLTILHKALKDGDYSIKGFEDLFAVERKQISDFYSYIGKEREKTVAKMERFADMINRGGWVGLAVECSEDEIFLGNAYSPLSPEVARQAINSFRIRYGVHVYMNNSRNGVRRFVLDSAIKFYTIKREV